MVCGHLSITPKRGLMHGPAQIPDLTKHDWGELKYQPCVTPSCSTSVCDLTNALVAEYKISG